MTQQKGLTQRISGIVLNVLNLGDSGSEKTGSEKPLSGLLQELYDGMVDTKNSVTYSMALVAMKRKKLREMVEKQEQIKAQAKHFESQGKEDLAKRLLGQTIAMDESISLATSELQNLDAQAKAEIVHFKDLEKKAEAYKGKIQAAEQMERFNKLRKQVTSAVSEFDTSVISQIDKQIDQIEMESAQVAATIALDSDKVQDIMIDQEVSDSLAQEKLEREYAVLKAEVHSDKKELPTAETTLLLEESPSDKAKLLLEQPAFDGILVPKV